MENIENLNKEEVAKLLEIFNIEPMGGYLIVTLNNTVASEDNPLEQDVMLNERQIVIAKGPMVRQIEILDEVVLDLDKMTQLVVDPHDAYSKIPKIKIKPVEFNGLTFGLIETNTINYIIK